MEKYVNLGLTEDNDVSRGELEQQTVQYYMGQAQVLHVSRLQDDMEFEGIAYCSKSYINPDLYESGKWSGTFHLIDGDGVKFKAFFYGMDVKFEEHQGPVFISGVKRYKGNNGGREYVEFRLRQIRQSTVDCPKSLFLKELPNYNAIKDTFRKNVDSLIPIGQMKLLLAKMDEYKILETLEQESFAETFGTFIGARMDAFNKACSMIYTLAPEGVQLDICYMGMLIKLWRPEVTVEGIQLDAGLNDNLLVQEIIYKSDLPKLTKIKLIDCLLDEGKSIEGKLVNNIYRTIADFYYSQDKLRFKSTEKLGLFI